MAIKGFGVEKKVIWLEQANSHKCDRAASKYHVLSELSGRGRRCIMLLLLLLLAALNGLAGAWCCCFACHGRRKQRHGIARGRNSTRRGRRRRRKGRCGRRRGTDKDRSYRRYPSVSNRLLWRSIWKILAWSDLGRASTLKLEYARVNPVSSLCRCHTQEIIAHLEIVQCRDLSSHDT